MDGKRNDEPPEPAEEYSDEELLKEFEAVKRMTVPLPIPVQSRMSLRTSGSGYRKEGEREVRGRRVPDVTGPAYLVGSDYNLPTLYKFW